MKVMPKPYFAYGANMSAELMQCICPSHRYLGVAELPEHRLAFSRRSLRTRTGVADVLPTSGRSVWGALYQLDDDELAAIDRKEGNGWAYERRPVSVRVDGGMRELEAIAYAVITPEALEVEPSPAYLDALLRAARERGLPDAYVEALGADFVPRATETLSDAAETEG